jgi:hypothetical protein
MGRVSSVRPCCARACRSATALVRLPLVTWPPGPEPRSGTANRGVLVRGSDPSTGPGSPPLSSPEQSANYAWAAMSEDRQHRTCNGAIRRPGILVPCLAGPGSDQTLMVLNQYARALGPQARPPRAALVR